MVKVDLYCILPMLLPVTSRAAVGTKHSIMNRRTITRNLEPLYGVGTPVYFEFEGEGWFSGEITDYDQGNYTVVWQDGENSVDIIEEGNIYLNQMVLQAADCLKDADNYCLTQTYSYGTKVYGKKESMEENDRYYSGEIVHFDYAGKYTVLWDSEPVSQSVYQESSLQQLIQAADDCTKNVENYCGTQSHPLGTHVAIRNSENHGSFEKGIITKFSFGTYTVTFEDLSQQTYKEGDVELSKMIAMAHSNIESGTTTETPTEQDIPLETIVAYKDASDGSFHTGKITKYVMGTYTVTWDDETKEKQTFEENDNKLYEMITLAHYIKDHPLPTSADKPSPTVEIIQQEIPLGTYVFKDAGNGSYVRGVVTRFDSGTYTVTWENGQSDTYQQGDDNLYKMIALAHANPSSTTQVATTTNEQETSTETNQEFRTGTFVAYEDESDGSYYTGVISGFQSGTYTVTWDDTSLGTDTYQQDDTTLYKMVVLAHSKHYKPTRGDNNVQSTFFEPTSQPTSQPTFVNTFEPTASGETSMQETVPLGTIVAYTDESDGSIYVGEITKYADGYYTITWADSEFGEDEYWEGDDELYDMIALAHSQQQGNSNIGSTGEPTYQPTATVAIQSYTIGTKVYFKFEDDRWVSGEITAYDQDELSYTVRINAADAFGEVDLYQDFEDGDVDLDLMVKQAENCRRNINNYCGTQSYSVGTLTYSFSENGWRSGRITKYDNGRYTVKWDDRENNVLVYTEGSDELVGMVNLAAECRESKENYCGTQSYVVGTVVYYDFDGQWYHGQVTGYDRGQYSITWQDGSVEEYEEGDMYLEQMVAQGAATGNSGLAPGGKAAISLVVIGLAFGGVFFVYRKRRTRIVLEQPEYQRKEADVQKSKAALMV